MLTNYGILFINIILHTNLLSYLITNLNEQPWVLMWHDFTLNFILFYAFSHFDSFISQRWTVWIVTRMHCVRQRKFIFYIVDINNCRTPKWIANLENYKVSLRWLVFNYLYKSFLTNNDCLWWKANLWMSCKCSWFA